MATAEVIAAAPREARPWRRAALMLAGLGVLFYVSYGFANWAAGQRSHVPSVVFGWEGLVPFVDWTILPYWTTNLFYAGSLFLCASRAELSVHVRRLFTTQIVAVACFLLVPLKFSWPKPETTGLFGFMFESLGAFDRPFNQAPSLHVALTVVLAALYLRHLPSRLVLPFLLWSALVVVSTMTTYQHHFIDLPTGLLLGFAVLWAWPMDRESPLAGARLARSAARRRLALRYAAAAAALAAVSLGIGNAALWLLWPALSLLLVACAYLVLGPAAFGKRADGRIDFAARVLLAPYLVGAFINSRLWTWRTPRPVEIADGVFLGRFPTAADLAGIATVVDLTAEFARPRTDVAWRAFPSLDLVAPEPARLAAASEAIAAAQPGGPVLVCCALGYGRSVAAVALWLVRSGRAGTVEAALAQLRRQRPSLVLSDEQRLAVEAALHV